MTVSSAPGKVYLFGEHAVVYGEPAVPCAVERRATVTVSARDDDHVVRVRPASRRLHRRVLAVTGRAIRTWMSPNRSSKLGWDTSTKRSHRPVTRPMPRSRLRDTVEGDIPLGAGLGSSAALVVAAIDAATRELGVELAARESPTAPTRPNTSPRRTGLPRRHLLLRDGRGRPRRGRRLPDHRRAAPPVRHRLRRRRGRHRRAGRRRPGLRGEYDFAADTVAAIGDIVREGESVLGTGDYERLGELMDFNHGLLSALGVSSRSLDSMVWAARDADAHGAKLTGAGGGGCIVALDETDDALTALKYTPGCEDVFRAERTPSESGGMTVVLKLGGSVVTDKDDPETVDRAALSAAVSAIAESPVGEDRRRARRRELRPSPRRRLRRRTTEGTHDVAACGHPRCDVPPQRRRRRCALRGRRSGCSGPPVLGGHTRRRQ